MSRADGPGHPAVEPLIEAVKRLLYAFAMFGVSGALGAMLLLPKDDLPSMVMGVAVVLALLFSLMAAFILLFVSGHAIGEAATRIPHWIGLGLEPLPTVLNGLWVLSFSAFVALVLIEGFGRMIDVGEATRLLHPSAEETGEGRP